MGEIFALTKPRNALQFTGERWTSAARGQIEVEHLHRYLVARDLCRGKDVLDIACGEGYGAAMLAQVAQRVVGIDVDRAAVAHAAAEYAGANLHYIAGDARRIPLATGSLDVVVSFETLEHFAEQEEFLAQLARILRPDGVLIISTPDSDVYSPIGGPANHYHVRELSREEFAATLSAHFSDVAILGQRALTGSAIIPRPAGAPETAPVTYERRDDAHFERSLGLPRPMYLIACASNGPLTGIPGSSIYVHASQVESTEELRAELHQAHASLQSAQAEAQSLRLELAAVKDRLSGTEIRLLTAEGLQDRERVEWEARLAGALQSCHEAEAARAEAEQLLREQHEAVAAVLSSTVWRSTYPLRVVGSKMPPWLRRTLRRGARLMWRIARPWRGRAGRADPTGGGFCIRRSSRRLAGTQIPFPK